MKVSAISSMRSSTSSRPLMRAWMSSRSKGVTKVVLSLLPMAWLSSSPWCSMAKSSLAPCSTSSSNRSKKRSSRGMRRMRMRPPGALGRRRPGGVLVRARAALLSFLLVRPQGTRSRRAGRSQSAGALPRGSPGPRLAPVSAIDPRHVLALDQGTSSSRAIVFDDRARPVAIAQYEVHSQFPHPGWVEQDAEALWAGQVRAGQQALAGAGLDAEEVAAVGITNQRETTVVWDGRGRPLAPAIVWQARRPAHRCAALRAGGVEPAVRARTGLLLDPYFSATKMAWLLEALPHGPDPAQARQLYLGTVDA